jgi:hypothetical protein
MHSTSKGVFIQTVPGQQTPETGWSTVHSVEPWLKQVEEATMGAYAHDGLGFSFRNVNFHMV